MEHFLGAAKDSKYAELDLIGIPFFASFVYFLVSSEQQE